MKAYVGMIIGYSGVNGAFVSFLSAVIKASVLLNKGKKDRNIKMLRLAGFASILIFLVFFQEKEEGMMFFMPALGFLFGMIADTQKEFIFSIK